MKVKWLGHASFLITSEGGTKIITDPYSVGAGLSYGKIQEAAGIVTISHEHFDHSNARAVKGNPHVIRRTGTQQVKGIEFRGLATYHDASKGRQRGPNTIFCFAVDGIRICHLGDLGHELSDEQLAEIGEVDVLIAPVGGFFTIDATEAGRICERLNPRVVIPMHYKTDKCGLPIATVDDFVKGRANVKRMDTSEVEVKKEHLPEATETVVLKHAL